MPRMPRRARRLEMNYIEDDEGRTVTFSKRRFGLFKKASDLAILTGASAAVVVASPNTGKMHAFGSPSVYPVVDAFLSGTPGTQPFVGEQEAARITRLQEELVELEGRLEEQNRMAEESMAREKLVTEHSALAKYIYQEEELNADELDHLFLELKKVQRDIMYELPLQSRNHQLEISGPSEPPPPPLWSRSLPLLPPSLQQPLSPLLPQTLVPLPSRERSLSYELPPIPPSLQRPLPQKAQPYNPDIGGLDISGQSPPPYNPTEPPLDYKNPYNISDCEDHLAQLAIGDVEFAAAGDPPVYQHWTSIPFAHPYYDRSLALDADIGNGAGGAHGNGGSVGSQQGSSSGGANGGGGAGNDHGEDFSWF